MKVFFEIEIDGADLAVNNLQELRTVIKRLNKDFENAEKGTPEFTRLQNSLAEVKQIQSGVRAETRRLSKEFERTKFPTGSLRELELRYQKIRNEIKNLSAEQRNSKFGRDLVRQAKTARNELNTINQSMGDFRTNVGNYQSAWKGVGNLLAGGLIIGALTKVGGALKDLGVEMFNQAVQADTLSRKSLIVLGESYDQVAEAAAENATALGITNQQYINQAANIADVLIPMGFQRQAAAELSTDLVDLSGALAEWSGGTKSAEDAQNALKAALTGEREQLKQYGIVLKEADISARLLEKGLSGLTGQALEQAKAQATLELITERSADAQTSFNENSDSLIRTQARLTASFNTIKESIATALIPVFGEALKVAEPFAQFISDQLPSALNFLKDTFAPVGDAIFNLIDVVRGANEESSLYSDTLGAFARGSLTLLANVLSSVINGVAQFISFVNGATDETGKFSDEAGFLQKALASVFIGISNLPAVFNGLVEVIKNSGTIVSNFARGALLETQILVNSIKGLVSQEAKDRAETLRGQLRDLRSSGLSAGAAFAKGFAEAKVQAENTVADVPTATATRTKKTYNDLGKEAGESFSEGVETTTKESTSAFDVLKEEAKGLKDEIKELAATGGEYGDELTRLNEITEKLNSINAIFKKDAKDTEEQLKRTVDQVQRLDSLPITVDANAQASPEIRTNRRSQNALDTFNQNVAADPDNRAQLEQDLQSELTRIATEGQIERLELDLQSSGLSIDGRIEKELELANLRKDLSDQEVANEQVKADRIAEIDKKRITQFQEGLELASSFADSLGQIQEAISQRRINQVNEQYDAELAAAEGNEEEIARITEERDARIEEIEREAFERNKRLAIAQALINGALAVTNIIATVPKFDFGIATAIQVAAAVASTAAQIATIGATSFSERGNLIPVDSITAERGASVKAGTFLQGKNHNQGRRGNTGIRFMFGGRLVEAQNGEFMDFDEFGNLGIVNATSSRVHRAKLQGVAGTSFPGKGKFMSDVNSWGGHGKVFAMQGALVPNLSGISQPGGGGGTQNITIRQEFSEEQFVQLESTIERAVERGAMVGTERGNITSNREIERDNQVNNVINGI